MEFCKKCNGTGIIISVDDGIFNTKKCECYEIAIAKERIKTSGMLRDKTFNNFNDYNSSLKQIKKKCMSYIPEKSLIITGQVGSGKTHLCMAIGNKLLDEGIPVVYMDYRKVVSDLKFNLLDREYFLNQISKYINTKVLIIDDLFKGGTTEAELKITYEIVNERYKKNLNFILSSEKSFDELMSIDGAITSRIGQNAKGNIINIAGKDSNYRLK